MRKVAGARNSRVKTMFKFFNSYMGSEPRELDVLICDEAHRVRENSANRYTKAELRAKSRRQIDELIDVAWVPVFLLDENQIVRPGEMGSLTEITAAAEAAECKVDVVRLDGQFRCGGSDSFDTWVQRLLGLTNQPPTTWSRLTAGIDDDFRVTTAASPTALEAWLRSQQDNHGGLPEWRPDTAGRGAIRSRPSKANDSSTMCGSTTGVGRGMRSRTSEFRMRRNRTTGHPTNGVSVRSAASIPRRDSNTTGPE